MSDKSESRENRKVVDLAAPALASALTPIASPATDDQPVTVTVPEGSDVSFEALQAQLRQFKESAPLPDATISADSDEKTRKDPSAPKHRGILEADYEGPSYSELKRRAQAQGSDENRLALPVDYMLQEYRIEKVLGIGGFGVSYLAHDTNLNAKVAIKEYLPNDLAVRNEETAAVLAKSTRDDEEYRIGLDRFLLESRTLATFRHPNIVRVNRFFEANNTAYMVMDYEFGESLNAWMRKRLERGDPPPDEAALLQMIVPLLQGLDKVHEAGFLHRDIKPANIYVRDSDGSLVLLDFGAARQTASAAKDGMTSIVTPGYAPFEQYHSHGRQGPWSDLYALGGVLYWFVAGRKPIEAAARIQSDPQESALEIGKGKYSEAFLKAIDWALLPDDQKRPQSVSEFLPVLIGDNQMGPIGSTGGNNKSTPLWMKLGFAAVTAVAIAAIGLNFMKPGRGIGGDPIRFGLNPGSARMTDDAQIRAKLDGFFQEVQKGTKRVIELELTADFKPLAEGKPKYDMIMAVTDRLGAAVRDHGYLPVAKFRDLSVHYFVKAGGKYADARKMSDFKGLKVGVFTRASTVGPIAVSWLVVNDVPVDASHIVEFKNQDEIADALMENRVDVIGISPNEAEAAKKKYGDRLIKAGESDPYPGYGIAIASTMTKDQAEKLTQVLWKLHESAEGRGALDNFDIGSSANTTKLRETNKREYEKALGQLERARALYPPAESKK